MKGAVLDEGTDLDERPAPGHQLLRGLITLTILVELALLLLLGYATGQAVFTSSCCAGVAPEVVR